MRNVLIVHFTARFKPQEAPIIGVVSEVEILLQKFPIVFEGTKRIRRFGI